MLRVFVDASVLFAAAYSATGAARDLLWLALEERVQLLVSQDILTETERNISRKVPDKLNIYKQIIRLLGLEVVADPSREAVQAAEVYVAQKDAFVIAAAIQSKADYLVTYDRKHLIDPPQVSAQSGLRIITPDLIVQAIRQDQGDEDQN